MKVDLGFVGIVWIVAGTAALLGIAALAAL
jgi:hypothetical protein